MGDCMSKDDACRGCYYWERAYSTSPCMYCSVAFSGCTENYYTDYIKFDAVSKPKHYMIGDKEAIEIIKASLTPEQYKGYCLGNVLKYRLRAGKKDDLEQDIEKANQYERMYEDAGKFKEIIE